MRYCPSFFVQWLNIGQVIFCVFMDRVEANKNAKSNEANIQQS